MNKRLAAVLTLSIGGALLVGATPAAAAPQRAVDPRPAATTPDGKSLKLYEFVGGFYSVLTPAGAGDSTWTETYRAGSPPVVNAKATATADVASLSSPMVGPFWNTFRACAATGGTTTCTAWNRAI